MEETTPQKPFNTKKLKPYLIPLLVVIIIGAIIIFLSLNTYVHVTKDSLVRNSFFSISEKEYNVSDLKEVQIHVNDEENTGIRYSFIFEDWTYRIMLTNKTFPTIKTIDSQIKKEGVSFSVYIDKWLVTLKKTYHDNDGIIKFLDDLMTR